MTDAQLQPAARDHHRERFCYSRPLTHQQRRGLGPEYLLPQPPRLGFAVDADASLGGGPPNPLNPCKDLASLERLGAASRGAEWLRRSTGSAASPLRFAPLLLRLPAAVRPASNLSRYRVFSRGPSAAVRLGPACPPSPFKVRVRTVCWSLRSGGGGAGPRVYSPSPPQVASTQWRNRRPGRRSTACRTSEGNSIACCDRSM